MKHHLDRIIKIKITNAKYMDTCLYLQMWYPEKAIT